jgi:toxin ParE1/3/4
MIKTRFNPIAISDMKEIKKYIEQDSPESAIKTINNILEKIESLSSFPNLGLNLSKKVNINTKYKYLICNKYIIFYLFENDTISIMRVIHGKRDYLKLLDIDIETIKE